MINNSFKLLPFPRTKKKNKVNVTSSDENNQNTLPRYPGAEVKVID